MGEAFGARCGRDQSVWAGPQWDLGCEGRACGWGHRSKLQEGWEPEGGGGWSLLSAPWAEPLPRAAGWGVLGADWRGRGLQRAPRAGAGRVGGASRCSRASGAAVAAAAATTTTTTTTRVGLRAEGRHGHDCGATAGRRGRGDGWPWLGERRVRVEGPELRPRGARRAKRARAGGGRGLRAEGRSTPGPPGAYEAGVARRCEAAWVYGPAQVLSGARCGTRCWEPYREGLHVRS